MPRKTRPPLERLMEKVSVDASSGCWLWTGSIKKNGYGRFGFNGKTQLAHRASFELHNGSVPAELDHRCRVRRCVNPAHLEPVTHRVNMLRGDTLPARNARRTHCKHGHEYTPENTHVRAGSNTRECKTCRRFFVLGARLAAQPSAA